MSRFDVDRAEALFIDDNLRNIKAAQALGIKSIHFTTSDELLKQFEENGVEI